MALDYHFQRSGEEEEEANLRSNTSSLAQVERRLSEARKHLAEVPGFGRCVSDVGLGLRL